MSFLFPSYAREKLNLGSYKTLHYLSITNLARVLRVHCCCMFCDGVMQYVVCMPHALATYSIHSCPSLPFNSHVTFSFCFNITSLFFFLFGHSLLSARLFITYTTLSSRDYGDRGRDGRIFSLVSMPDSADDGLPDPIFWNKPTASKPSSTYDLPLYHKPCWCFACVSVCMRVLSVFCNNFCSVCACVHLCSLVNHVLFNCTILFQSTQLRFILFIYWSSPLLF
jgi:hypothetical protein